MVHGVTTEWDDVQVKMGNYKANPHVATNDEIFQEVTDGLEYYDNKAIMTNDQLAAQADDDLDFDDDEFMQDYRAKRMEQMQEYA